MIAVYDFPQNSDAWYDAKRGIPSASGFAHILTSEGKRSGQRKAYLYKLAGERVAGRSDEGYYSKAMEQGHLLEEAARRLFALTHGVHVDTPAFCFPDERRRYLCSPDGLIQGRQEGMEIKSPELTAAVWCLAEQRVPPKYIPQVQGSLMVSGYDAWWFMSYCPGLKPLYLRVARDEAFITLLREAVEEFCDELDSLAAKIAA